MTKIVCLVLLCLSISISSSFEKGDPAYPKKQIFNVGYSHAVIETEWKSFGNTDEPNTVDDPPVHSHLFGNMVFSYDSRSILQTGPLHFDLHNEFKFSIIEKLDQSFLDTLPVKLSENSLNIGFAANIRYSFPYMISSTTRIVPYLSVGLGFDYVSISGEDIKEEFNQPRIEDLSYSSGWSESYLSVPLGGGLSIDLGNFFIAPEFKYHYVFFTSSTWEAGSHKPEMDKILYWNAQLSFGFNLGY